MLTGVYLPDLNSPLLCRRECVVVRNRQLGDRVRKVVAPDIGVCPDFMKGGAQAQRSTSNFGFAPLLR